MIIILFGYYFVMLLLFFFVIMYNIFYLYTIKFINLLTTLFYTHIKVLSKLWV